MRRAKVLLLAGPLVLLVGVVAFVLLRTQRGLEHARTAVDKRGELGFELRRLDGWQTRAHRVVFEPVASATGFVAGMIFRENLYLAGPAGLYVYGANGSDLGDDGLAGMTGAATLLRTYRVGQDLPAAPLGPMAVGTLRGDSEPELMIATAGEGVLLFTPGAAVGGIGSFRQLRPDLAEMRDITALLPLQTGELLIGTRRAGLLVYSGSTLTVFRPEMAGVPVTALADDGAGGFWAGTRDRGALHWSGGTMERVDAAGGLPDDQVESLLVHGADVLVGTPVGVAELRNGRVARQLAPGTFAHTLAVAADGKSLAVGTMEDGVVEVPLNTSGARRGISLAGIRHESGPVAGLLRSGGDTYAILPDSVRRRAAGGAWETVVSAPPAALTDGNISALRFGEDGRLWVGYFDHGVDVLGADVLEGQPSEGTADLQPGYFAPPRAGAAQLDDKLLGRHAGQYSDLRVAPSADLSEQATGSATDLETRIDAPPMVAIKPAEQMRLLHLQIAAAGIVGVLTVDSNEVGAMDAAAATASMWIPFHSGVVLRTARAWDESAIETALVEALEPRLSAGNLGLAWNRQSGGYASLGQIEPLQVAVRGNLLLITDDAKLMETMLARTRPVTAASVEATSVGGFNHEAAAVPFARLSALIDRVDTSTAQTSANQAEAGNTPAFFSGNLAGMSRAFTAMRSERVVERRDGPVVRQTVTYAWQR